MSLNTIPVDKLPDMSKMTKLKKLSLPNHHIKNIDRIPVTVEEVNLNNNMIEDLPNMKYVKSLKHISLSNNKLHTFPEFPDHAVHINLDNNSVQSVKNLSNMKDLEYLSLTDNKISVLFGLSVSLQFINIKGNPIRTLHRACFPSEELYELLKNSLTWDQIDDLHQPPPQIFRRGYNAVIQYYEQAYISKLTGNYKNR